MKKVMPVTAAFLCISQALAAAPLKDHKELKFTLPAAESKLAVSDDQAAMDKLVASAAFSKAMNAAAKTLLGKSCDPQSLSTIHNEAPNLAGLLESIKGQASMVQKPATYQYTRLANGYYTLSTTPGFDPHLGIWALVGSSAAFFSCQVK